VRILLQLLARLFTLVLPRRFRKNHPPSVQISAPSGGFQPAPVALRYVVADAESDPVHIAVTYSTDGGHTFQPASEAQHAGSEGTLQLRSSPVGVTHRFAWDALADLHAAHAIGVRLRLRAFDRRPGGTATTPPFDVGIAVETSPPVP